ncbi:MAG TPA: response regulator [Acidobacteriota bacterium]|nr:response regulator [Acidobacteriota bacterium]
MRVLIVDDEPPARRKLRRFLSDEEDFEVVGEASSGTEAVDAIRRLRPQAVFLDIQMPEMDGFEVLRELHRELDPAAQEAADLLPRIVFVTAYDQFALKAFEVAALDYLLKPYDRQRLRQALQRLRREARQPNAGKVQEGLQELLSHLRRERQHPQRLMVRSQGRVRFIRVEEIDWIGAAGNYAEIHQGSRTHLLRETLSNLEERLDPRHFVRVHRSAIVNLEQVREVHPYSKNDYVVVLASGEKVRMSRNYRQRLEEAADFP